MSFLIDSFAKGVGIGAAGRKAYDSRVDRAREDREWEAREAYARTAAEALAIPSPHRPGGTGGTGGTGDNSSYAAGVPEPASDGELGGYSYDSAVDAGLREVQAASEGPITTRDHSQMRQRLIEAAAATGDPDLVAKANKFYTDVQHKGFLDNLKMANVFMGSGNMESAMRYLQTAYQYFPDGNDGDFAITPDGRSILLRPTDEASGEQRPIVTFNKRKLEEMLANFTAPVNFSQWNYEQKYKEDERDYQRGRDADTDRRAQEKHDREGEAHRTTQAGRRQSQTHAAAAEKRREAEESRREALHPAALATAETAADRAKREEAEASTPEAVAARRRERDLKLEAAEARLKTAKTQLERAKRNGQLTQDQYFRLRANYQGEIGTLQDMLLTFSESEREGPEYKAMQSQVAALEADMAEMERLFRSQQALPPPGGAAQGGNDPLGIR